jgi:lipopolysaccharide transport system permease protein
LAKKGGQSGGQAEQGGQGRGDEGDAVSEAKGDTGSDDEPETGPDSDGDAQGGREMSEGAAVATIRRVDPHVVSSSWREVWANRSILWFLAKRDLKSRYAGSILGVIWNVVHPIVMIGIYILILGAIVGAKFGGSGPKTGNYAIHLCAGMVPWLVFREVVSRCSTIILENAGLIRKVVFPEIVLHLTVLINALIVHVVSYTVLLALVSLLAGFPAPSVLLGFGILLAIGVFALGLGLIVSAFNVYFRDIGQLLLICLELLFWFTPIVYPPRVFADSPRAFMHAVGRLVELNPVVHFVRLSQWLLGDPPEWAAFSWTSVVVVAVVPIVAMVIGLRVFNSFKRDILDII